MAKTIVGVDIGSTSLRAVEIADAAKARPTLLRFAEIAVPEGCVSRGEVLEPNTVGGLLKQLWSQGGFKSKRVVLGMGNQRVLARDLSVPSAPLNRIRETLPFVAQDMLPVPVQDALLDFYPISETMTENGLTTHGLLVAAVKEAVAGNVKAVQAAGLTAVEVDLIPFALDRLLIGRPKVPGTVALVDIGAYTTSVVVAAEGVPQFVRIIPTGGADLTASIASRLEVGVDEAERHKRRIGIAASASTAEEHAVATAIIDSVTDVLSSLRNTIAYYSNTRPSSPVASIVLCGGGAHLPGLVTSIAEYTGLPSRLADPFASVAVARSLNVDQLRAEQPSISVALGLALGSEAA